MFEKEDFDIDSGFSVIGMPTVLNVIPVYSAGKGSFGNGGCKDIYKIEATIEFKISADVTIFKSVERTYERTIVTFVEYSAPRNGIIPTKLYRPYLWIRPELWENAPIEILNIVKENNRIYDSLEKELNNFYEKEKDSIIEELANVVIEKEEEEEEKEHSNNESISDYNSQFGVTSTWCGDAGWMDDD